MENEDNFEQTAIIPIEIGELTAPVQASIEESKLANTIKTIIKELILDIRRLPDGDFYIPSDLLPWVREYRAVLKDVYGMFEGVKKEVQFKKIDVLKDFIIKGKLDLPEDTKLAIIKSLSKEDKKYE